MVNQTHDGSDARVREALDVLGLEYEVTDGGCFRLEFGLPEGRTQLVYIDSATARVGSLELRKIWSCGYMGTSRLPGEICADLLDANRDVPFGAWETFSDGDDHFLVFGTRVPAETEASSLRSILVTIAEYADQIESHLADGDSL